MDNTAEAAPDTHDRLAFSGQLQMKSVGQMTLDATSGGGAAFPLPFPFPLPLPLRTVRLRSITEMFRIEGRNSIKW